MGSLPWDWQQLQQQQYSQCQAALPAAVPLQIVAGYSPVANQTVHPVPDADPKASEAAVLRLKGSGEVAAPEIPPAVLHAGPVAAIAAAATAATPAAAGAGALSFDSLMLRAAVVGHLPIHVAFDEQQQQQQQQHLQQ
jgi:hypothetical protein